MQDHLKAIEELLSSFMVLQHNLTAIEMLCLRSVCLVPKLTCDFEVNIELPSNGSPIAAPFISSFLIL